MSYIILTKDDSISNAIFDENNKSKIENLSNSEKNTRNDIYNFLKNNSSFCRKGNEFFFKHLLEDLLNERKTCIFLHSGYKISGLINFSYLKNLNSIKISSFCVPDNEEKFTGCKFLNIVKQIGILLKVDKILLEALNDSPELKKYYEKNGFIANYGYMEYIINNNNNNKSCEQMSNEYKNAGKHRKTKFKKSKKLKIKRITRRHRN